MLNIYAHDLAFRIEVQDHAILNLAAVHARTSIEVNIERIRFAIILQLPTYLSF